MYVFRPEHLTLDIQLVCFSLGMTTSLKIIPGSFPRLPLVLHVGLRLGGMFPNHFSMFIGIVLVQFTFEQSYW